MKMTLIKAAVAAGLVCGSAAVQAHTPSDDPGIFVTGYFDEAEAMPVEAPAAPPSPRDPAVLSEDELAGQRGGFVIGSQTLTAVTTGNVINGDYVAGNVFLSDNALSNFTGVGNLLINTGGQVSVQAAMNLSIDTDN